MLDFLGLYLPTSENIKGRYVEPFVGSCVVYFSVNPKSAILSDINPDLIDLLNGIKLSPCGVWQMYCNFGNDKSSYKVVRDEIIPKTIIEKAARVLFLNRTCFKGMWRTNLQGGFNVGYGGQERRWAITENNLIEVAEALSKAEISCEDFETTLQK